MGRNNSKNSNCSSSKRCEQETTCYRWLIHFSDREPLEVAFSPPASHAEVLADYPDALAAEPIEDDLSGALERNDTPPADGMHFCTECSNLRGGLCGVAKPGGLVSAIVGYRPLPGLLVRCAGYSATAGGNDQRPGRERLAPMEQEAKHADH